MTPTIRTTCPYCGVGCGVIVSREGETWRIQGDPDHPANHGRLCAKGAALADTLDTRGRLLQPEIGGHPVTLDTALDTVARRFSETITRHGPESVAFYVSGQLLTEDYYVANKLMKGFIGTANIDTNSRLCMSSPAAAHQFAFGEDLVAGCYQDLEQADLLVLVGWNAAYTHPVLYQRMAQARQQEPHKRVVVIDPRRTPTCELADLHLALRPGSDAWLFNGLLAYLQREAHLDWPFLEQHVVGFGPTLTAVAGLSIPEVARRCGLGEAEVAVFYRLFASTPRTTTVFSQGVNQSATAVDTAMAIINVHLATGRIGKPGATPFSITGQPNAMGGREVGGLATQLAAHRDFSPENRSLVQAFWRAPRIASEPGLKAVDMFDAISTGRIRAIWIMATNPAVSLPDAEAVREALRRCDFVVVSDVVASNDTLRFAHVKLPAAAWGEKNGTVTNSERCISRQRAFLPLPGLARPDWWLISQVAARMGFGASFCYDGPHAILREHAALTALGTPGPRLRLDAGLNMSPAQYDALAPAQWPAGAPRLFTDGVFAHPDGKARMKPVQGCDTGFSPDFPLRLNNGRIRDQWHTMTRTGLVPRLFAHTPEPYIDLHPRDAAAAGVTAGQWVWVENMRGRLVARARITSDVMPGDAFFPIHWNDAFASQARVGALLSPQRDPVSGQPAFKSGRVRIHPMPIVWQGRLYTRVPLELPPGCFWHKVPLVGGWRFELAGLDMAAWQALAQGLEGPGEWLRLQDTAAGRLRLARLTDGHLEALLFVEPPQGRLPDPGWLDSLFPRPALEPAERMSLLSGRAPAGIDAGPILCACHAVGEASVVAAIQDGAHTVQALGQRLKAGTGCGACVPELTRLLRRYRATAE